MKYFGINLTKYVHEIYEKNYKTLINKIKGKLNKWKGISSLWIRRLNNIIKISVLSNSIYIISAILVKIPACYFVTIGKLVTKCIWKGKTFRITNIILKDKYCGKEKIKKVNHDPKENKKERQKSWSIKPTHLQVLF